MKLLSTALSTALFLSSLLFTTTLATLHVENLPSKLHAGTSYELQWSADNEHDYEIMDFYLVHQDSSSRGWEATKPVVFKYIELAAGSNHSMLWTVPGVKNQRIYALWMSACVVPEGNYDNYTYVQTEWFEIEGGPVLYKKEIAGVVVGTVVGLALIIAAVVVVPRCIRKRRSVAVDLS